MYKANAVRIITLHIIISMGSCQFTPTENTLISSLAQHLAADYSILTVEHKDSTPFLPTVKLLSRKYIFTTFLTPSKLMEYVEPENYRLTIINNRTFDSKRTAIFWKTDIDSLKFHLSKVICASNNKKDLFTIFYKRCLFFRLFSGI